MPRYPPYVTSPCVFGYHRKAIRLIYITSDFETTQLTPIGPTGGLVCGLLFLSCLSCFAVEGQPRAEHVNDTPTKPARPPCTGTTLA
jgi:hypothetical protein